MADFTGCETNQDQMAILNGFLFFSNLRLHV